MNTIQTTQKKAKKEVKKFILGNSGTYEGRYTLFLKLNLESKGDQQKLLDLCKSHAGKENKVTPEAKHLVSLYNGTVSYAEKNGVWGNYIPLMYPVVNAGIDLDSDDEFQALVAEREAEKAAQEAELAKAAIEAKAAQEKAAK